MKFFDYADDYKAFAQKWFGITNPYLGISEYDFSCNTIATEQILPDLFWHLFVIYNDLSMKIHKIARNARLLFFVGLVGLFVVLMPIADRPWNKSGDCRGRVSHTE